VFDFRNSPDFANGIPAGTLDPELSLEQLAAAANVVDTDEDGVPNGIDNCPGLSNPLQEDQNANGIGDACEPDQGPPTIDVQMAPNVIWPPNNKMVSVTANIIVSDDSDPAPQVKLIAATCDDGCNPSSDIQADLQTDDRQVSVKASRKGNGPGRTYSFTYSATDRTGKTSRLSANVFVPHDRSAGP
jgi:hypothetical protein